MQWNVNLQRSLGRDYLVEVAYTGSRSRNLSKRYNINQADFGTTPINSRLPFPQFQPAMLYSSATGWANFKGLSLRLEKRYSAGLFFLANYQLSENRDNGSGEVEANDTAFRTNLDADASLSRYHQRHRSAFSFGYELPFGEGRRWLNRRRCSSPTCSAGGRCKASSGRAADSRSPCRARTSASAARSFPSGSTTRPGVRDDRGELEDPTVAQMVRQDRLRPAGVGIPGHGWPQHVDRAQLEAGGFLGQQALPDRSRAPRIPRGDLQSVQPRRTSGSRTGTSATSLPGSSPLRTTPGTCSSACASPGEAAPSR